MIILIKHQQLLGPWGGKTSQPLNQDNAFCVTGTGTSCPASPPSPCISSFFLPSHLHTLRQARSCHAASVSKNKWWPPKCMVKARQVGRAGHPLRAVSVTSRWCALYWWIVLITNTCQEAHTVHRGWTRQETLLNTMLFNTRPKATALLLNESLSDTNLCLYVWTDQNIYNLLTCVTLRANVLYSIVQVLMLFCPLNFASSQMDIQNFFLMSFRDW